MKRLTLEHALYLALFGLALALRLYGLGAHPLTDTEAREALTVFRFLRSPAEVLLVPHSPAYFSLTYLGFLVFGASEMLARLAPALFGAALVFAPLFFRDALGRGGALLTAALLTFTAGLLQASRSADGSVLALSGLVFGLGAFREYWRTERIGWLAASGVALGFGLASGAAFLTGLVVVCLAVVVLLIISPTERERLAEAWARLQTPAVGRTWAAALLLAALAAATAGLLYPRGLGALTASWGAWLTTGSGRAPLTLPFFVLAYEPALALFGLIGAVRAFRSGHRAGQWLAWAAAAGLAFTALHRGRALADVIWLEAPLAALTAYAVADMLQSWWVKAEWPLTAAQAGLVTILFSFTMVNLAAFGEQVRLNQPVAAGQTTLADFVTLTSPYFFLSVAALGVGLVLLISFLFGLGWSPRAAQLGLMLCTLVVLVSGGLSASWGLTQLRANQPVELWWAAPERPVTDDVQRLLAALEAVGHHSLGEARDIEVIAQADSNGALAWALRDYPRARFVAQIDAGIESPVVITPIVPENPTLGSAYVGQPFALHRIAALDLSWTEWLGWWTYRRAPEQLENVVLWVRQDIQQLQTVGQ